MTYYGTRLSDNISRREPEGAEMNVSPVDYSAKPEVNRKPAESTSIANESAAIRL